jgi:uncharacterized membrane protein
MGNLFVVGFNEPNQAEEVRLKLQKLEDEGLLDLADVVVAVKDEACGAYDSVLKRWRHLNFFNIVVSFY